MEPNCQCVFCGAFIYRKPYFLRKHKPRCNLCISASAIAGAKLYAKAKYEKYIKLWKRGLAKGMKGSSGISSHIRKYLFIKYNNACCKCGWNKTNSFTNRIPLEVNHLDGDFRNNKEENLELICPNCHSLTGNYKSRNRGKGRPVTRGYVKVESSIGE